MENNGGLDYSEGGMGAFSEPRPIDISIEEKEKLIEASGETIVESEAVETDETVEAESVEVVE